MSKNVLVITINAEWEHVGLLDPTIGPMCAQVRAEVPWEPDPATLRAAVRNLATAAMMHPELMGEATRLSLVFGEATSEAKEH